MAFALFTNGRGKANVRQHQACPRDGMVDIRDLKSLGLGRAGSSPAAGTTLLFFKFNDIHKTPFYKGFMDFLSYINQPRVGGVLKV